MCFCIPGESLFFPAALTLTFFLSSVFLFSTHLLKKKKKAKSNHIVGHGVSLFTGVNGSEGWGYRLFFSKACLWKEAQKMGARERHWVQGGLLNWSGVYMARGKFVERMRFRISRRQRKELHNEQRNELMCWEGGRCRKMKEKVKPADRAEQRCRRALLSSWGRPSHAQRQGLMASLAGTGLEVDIAKACPNVWHTEASWGCSNYYYYRIHGSLWEI